MRWGWEMGRGDGKEGGQKRAKGPGWDGGWRSLT